MPHRSVATKEMAKLLGVLSHPDRIRIVEELRDEERDVNQLAEILGIAHSRVSQHLALLRSHRVAIERREGRHVFYRLVQPQLARWLAVGLQYIDGGTAHADIHDAVERARAHWLGDADA